MIEVRHLCKSYDNPVLKDVSLSVRRGSIMGLLGPNGAGKTTMISILTGVIGKDSGCITVNGLDLDRELKAIQSQCSYVPQTLAFYRLLTAVENLEYFGALWGLKGKSLKERIDFCIDIGSMQSFAHKRVNQYSGGMMRRLNLAIGLLNDPEILYLDEPTVGVDTQSRNYILKTIRRINRERKTTIVYTSHYMDEIEQVSDDIAIIDDGAIILHNDKKNILNLGDAVVVYTDRMPPDVVDLLQRIIGVRVEKNRVFISRDEHFNRTMADMFILFHDRGVRVEDAACGHGTLEELFLRLTNTGLRDDN